MNNGKIYSLQYRRTLKLETKGKFVIELFQIHYLKGVSSFMLLHKWV